MMSNRTIGSVELGSLGDLRISIYTERYQIVPLDADALVNRGDRVVVQHRRPWGYNTGAGSLQFVNAGHAGISPSRRAVYFDIREPAPNKCIVSRMLLERVFHRQRYSADLVFLRRTDTWAQGEMRI